MDLQICPPHVLYTFPLVQPRRWGTYAFYPASETMRFLHLQMRYLFSTHSEPIGIDNPLPRLLRLSTFYARCAASVPSGFGETYERKWTFTNHDSWTRRVITLPIGYEAAEMVSMASIFCVESRRIRHHVRDHGLSICINQRSLSDGRCIIHSRVAK